LTKLKIGDQAPGFSLPSQTGEKVNITDFRDKKNIVLFFYPRDYTAGCTAEVCSFRDNYQDFKDAWAEVIGISVDSTESHSQFAATHSLPFTLLSDEGGKIRDLYGVTPNFLGMVPGRVTFVIDKKGIIRYIFSSLLQPLSHIEKSLEIIKFIDSEG
jgi:peroxiredoxin Q/BCP